MMSDLYEACPCGYQSLDQQGLVVPHEPDPARLARLPPRRAGRQGYFRDLLTPASQQVFVEHFPSPAGLGQIRDCRVDLQRRDGTVLPVSIPAPT